MKKVYSLLFLALFTFIISCTDESLDPLQFKKVQKGTLLALRGTQLQNIYIDGVPGAQFVPGLAGSSDKFVFEGEFLSEDPSTLSSIDVFVLDKDGVRHAMTTVQGSAFTATGGGRPKITVSLNLSDILVKLGYPATLPVSAADANDLFANYENGIVVETDLNLTDGSKVVPGDLVAAGLYQSDQFYPAQSLVYTVIHYCPEDLEGTYDYSTTVIKTGVDGGGDISGCGGTVTGSGELTKVEDAFGVYDITDASFGMYDCAYDGADPAEGVTLINTCDKITVGGADQNEYAYSFTAITVSADRTQLTFTWENDNGDKGTTVLTRTDSKLWPSTLH